MATKSNADARFHLRLTSALAERLTRLAEAHGETRAAVLRRLILAAKLPKGTA